MKRRGELSSHGLERGYSMRGETEVMSGRTESFKDQNFTSVKCKLPLSHVIGSLCRRESGRWCKKKKIIIRVLAKYLRGRGRANTKRHLLHTDICALFSVEK